MHYILVILITIFIVAWQFYLFFNNRRNIKLLKNAFPDNIQENLVVATTGIKPVNEDLHRNEIFEKIISLLNNYLENNQRTFKDYQIIKEIVERNCETKEEEIQNLIPVPLYLGLAGTMFGILIGIGFLVISGGLNDILTSPFRVGSQGIETLLGGIALAMISSILGIILTIIGSHLFKDAKSVVEENKNQFLGLIQARLMPHVNQNITEAINTLTHHLNNLNNTFQNQGNQFNNLLEELNKYGNNIKHLFEQIQNLNIIQTTRENRSLLNALNRATTAINKLVNDNGPIGQLANHLNNVNLYIETFNEIYQHLDIFEQRTQVIENAGIFFQHYEHWLANHIDEANIQFENALNNFLNNAQNNLHNLDNAFNLALNNLLINIQNTLNNINDTINVALNNFLLNADNNILAFNTILQHYQETLNQHLEQITINITHHFNDTFNVINTMTNEVFDLFVDRLNEANIIDGMNNINEIRSFTNNINNTLNDTKNEIQNLRNVVEQTREIFNQRFSEMVQIMNNLNIPHAANQPEMRIDFLNNKLYKVLFISSTGIIITSGLFYLIPKFISLSRELISWLFL